MVMMYLEPVRKLILIPSSSLGLLRYYVYAFMSTVSAFLLYASIWLKFR